MIHSLHCQFRQHLLIQYEARVYLINYSDGQLKKI